MEKVTAIFLFIFIVISHDLLLGQSIKTNYLDLKDSTRNYYITIEPKGNIQAAVVFIPGLYQTPEQLLLETEIDELLAGNNILLIVPFLTKKSLHFEEETISFLRIIIENIFKGHSIKDQNLIIGGFSSGGATAAMYAELTLSKELNSIPPKALFLIDSPIDNERLALNELKSTIYKNLNIQQSKNTNVSAYFVARFQEIFGLDYLNNPQFYKWSPYSKSDTTFKNIKPLIDIPVRFYSEPDFVFFFERDGTKFNPNVMNVLDGSLFINDLKFLGNSNAKLILTSNKGFRRSQNNKRHPHSISIVDAKEFLTWVNDIVDGN